MTVSTTTSRVRYEGDGATSVFPIPFKFVEKAHVTVTLRDAASRETLWREGSEYDLSGAGGDGGGTLTVRTAPVDHRPRAGEVLVVALDLPFTQDKAFPLGGAFPSTQVEEGLDLAALRDAQLAAFDARAFSVPATDARIGALELPIDRLRAGRYLGFDATGKPAMLAGTAEAADLSDKTVLAAGGTTARPLAAHLGGVLNVKDYGAKGDGITDDTAAIQAAVDAVGTQGGIVWFPPTSGRYVVSSTITITIGGTTIVGNGIGSNTIQVVTHDFDIFDVQAGNCRFENLSVLALATGLTEGFVINETGGTGGLSLFSCKFQGVFSGIQISQASTFIQHLRLREIKPERGRGIVINGTSELHDFHHVVAINGEGNDAFSAVHAVDARAVSMKQCQFVKMGTPLNINPGNGQVASSLDFEDCWFDTSAGSGVFINPTGTGIVRRVRLNNCWLSSNARGVRVSGNCEGLQIIGGHCYGNINEGILLEAGLSLDKLQMIGVAIAGNGGAGVNVQADISRFKISDCVIGPHNGFGANSAGITVQPGASDDYIITDNDLRGNIGAALSDAGTGANKQVFGNLPYTDAESLNIGNGASIKRHLSGTATFDPPSLANGASTGGNVTVVGAAAGDTVVATFNQLTIANWQITGFVVAPGVVRVVITNQTGGTVDLPSGILRADVWKH